MVKRSIGLELETKKKIKIGKNSIKLHGDKLDIPAGKALLINMQLNLPGHLWFVNPATITAATKMVSFDAHLHVPTPTPVSSDSGDLTITLMYTDDNEPIEVACEEVQIESTTPVAVTRAAKKK